MNKYIFKYEKLNGKKIDVLNFVSKDETSFVLEKNCEHQILKFILPDALRGIDESTIDYRLNINLLEAHNLEYIRDLTFIGSKIRFYNFEKCSFKTLERATFLDSHIEGIKLPSSLEDIEENAFNGSKLSTIIFPSTLRVIGLKSFADCKNLTKIVLPENLNYLSDRAFENCENLEEVTLPKALKYMTDHTFENCHNLKTIIVPKDIKPENFEWIMSKDSLKNIKKIKYLGNKKETIDFLEKYCLNKGFKFEANSIDYLLKNGKSFKEINDFYINEAIR